MKLKNSQKISVLLDIFETLVIEYKETRELETHTVSEVLKYQYETKKYILLDSICEIKNTILCKVEELENK